MIAKPITIEFSNDDFSYSNLLCLSSLIKDVLSHYGYGKLAEYLGKENCFYEYTDKDSGLPAYSRRSSLTKST